VNRPTAQAGSPQAGHMLDAMAEHAPSSNDAGLLRSLSLRVALALDRARSRLWVVPAMFVLAALGLALVSVSIDRLVDQTLTLDVSSVLFSGGPESARLVLSTIAAAMMTFTGLVFSVTMLVLQLASSQLSPRVTRTFLRDRVNQAVLGLFVATFVYALLVLREVRSGPDSPFVPAIAVTLAFALLLASVGAFVLYINHMAQAMRAITVIRSVASETRSAIERIYPEDVAGEPSAGEAPPPPERVPDLWVATDRSGGILVSVDDAALVRVAEEFGAVIELLPHVGDYVPARAQVFRVWLDERKAQDPPPTDAPAEIEGAIRGSLQLGPERTMNQDAAFGFRQLVDIAERALSPGTNDPTTAVQALDELHDLLRELAGRDIASPTRVTDDGRALLILPRPAWPDYVSLALDELRHYGAGSIQVARRMRYLLLDLQTIAPPSRMPPIERQLRLLDAGILAEFALADDQEAAATPSSTGQGPVEEPPTPPPSTEAVDETS
jgi:uncharacterized membrane protein